MTTLAKAERYGDKTPYRPIERASGVLATDGKTIVATCSRTRVDLVNTLYDVASAHGPSYRQIAESLREASFEVAVEVSLDTAHDQEMRAKWQHAQPAIIEALKLQYAKAPRGEKFSPRKRLLEAEKELKHLDHAYAHGFRAYRSCFDLRLIRKMLKFFGVKSATLHLTNDPLAFGCLETERGIGLIMPFRY